jgi:hypothetical protein
VRSPDQELKAYPSLANAVTVTVDPFGNVAVVACATLAILAYTAPPSVGLVSIVRVTFSVMLLWTKYAPTLLLAVIVTDVGFWEPEISPTQWSKIHPVAAVAVMGTKVPESYVFVFAGDTVPIPTTYVDSEYV